MTTFWGVCGSCSPDWDTKASANVPGLGRLGHSIDLMGRWTPSLTCCCGAPAAVS